MESCRRVFISGIGGEQDVLSRGLCSVPSLAFYSQFLKFGFLNVAFFVKIFQQLEKLAEKNLGTLSIGLKKAPQTAIYSVNAIRRPLSFHPSQ